MSHRIVSLVDVHTCRASVDVARNRRAWLRCRHHRRSRHHRRDTIDRWQWTRDHRRSYSYRRTHEVYGFSLDPCKHHRHLLLQYPCRNLNSCPVWPMKSPGVAASRTSHSWKGSRVREEQIRYFLRLDLFEIE